MYAYARFGSLPSLFGSFGIGGLMALSSMRMRDNLDYGVEGAAGKHTSAVSSSGHIRNILTDAASSAMMAIPTAM